MRVDWLDEVTPSSWLPLLDENERQRAARLSFRVLERSSSPRVRFCAPRWALGLA